MERIVVPLVPLDPDLPIPRYAYPGDAGVDLRTACDLEIEPFGRQLVPTGIAIALPDGFAGLVVPRSGLAVNHGVSIVNTPGIIDSNYRGEIKVCLVNLDSRTPFVAHRGDRIAQLVVIEIPSVEFAVCDDLDGTGRGARGFGSSGM